MRATNKHANRTFIEPPPPIASVATGIQVSDAAGCKQNARDKNHSKKSRRRPGDRVGGVPPPQKQKPGALVGTPGFSVTQGFYAPLPTPSSASAPSPPASSRASSRTCSAASSPAHA